MKKYIGMNGLVVVILAISGSAVNAGFFYKHPTTAPEQYGAPAPAAQQQTQEEAEKEKARAAWEPVRAEARVEAQANLWLLHPIQQYILQKEAEEKQALANLYPRLLYPSQQHILQQQEAAVAAPLLVAVAAPCSFQQGKCSIKVRDLTVGLVIKLLKNPDVSVQINGKKSTVKYSENLK